MPPSSTGSPSGTVKDPSKDIIPQFYFENDPPLHDEFKELYLSLIGYFFHGHTDGLQQDAPEFKHVTKGICKLPSFFSVALFKKIDVDSTRLVSRDAFINYWIHGSMYKEDIATHIFTILKKPDAKYLTQDDFNLVIGEFLATHHGLRFLDAIPQIRRDRYAETIKHRIFYYINQSGNGHLTLKEMKRSDLIPAMLSVDEGDIASIKYFSYRDFYVIDWNFRALDMDHDFLIDKHNLRTYRHRALSLRIVDRIFDQVPRKFTSKVEGKMGYEDFVYFILAEEDKPAETSLAYWFKCIDLDGKGGIIESDMKWFYEEQFTRVQTSTGQEIEFQNILYETVDMINPKNPEYITLSEIKRSKFSPVVFNMLFNAAKFRANEKGADPAQIFADRANDGLSSEWERFASREYERISEMEDDVSSWGDSDDSDDDIIIRPLRVGFFYEAPF